MGRRRKSTDEQEIIRLVRTAKNPRGLGKAARERAWSELYSRCQRVLWTLQTKHPRVHIDELRSTYGESLMKSVRSYDESHGISFISFMYLVFESAVRADYRERTQSRHDVRRTISIDLPRNELPHNNDFHNLLSKRDQAIERLDDLDHASHYWSHIKRYLTPTEREIVWAVHIAGRTYKEAAERLGIPYKKVDNGLIRARFKIAEVVKHVDHNPLKPELWDVRRTPKADSTKHQAYMASFRLTHKEGLKDMPGDPEEHWRARREIGVSGLRYLAISATQEGREWLATHLTDQQRQMVELRTVQLYGFDYIARVLNLDGRQLRRKLDTACSALSVYVSKCKIDIPATLSESPKIVERILEGKESTPL